MPTLMGRGFKERRIPQIPTLHLGKKVVGVPEGQVTDRFKTMKRQENLQN
jgi:hypothetical protein